MFFILKILFGNHSDAKTTCVYCSQNIMFGYISLSQSHSVYTFAALQQTLL